LTLAIVCIASLEFVGSGLGCGRLVRTEEAKTNQYE
jgi:hypothetical protein